ncbi:hypothetical protein D3C84_938730 [compost metagenome]
MSVDSQLKRSRCMISLSDLRVFELYQLQYLRIIRWALNSVSRRPHLLIQLRDDLGQA